ncbi:hypothetical protein BJF78_31095 [Pseudonocardia sp. CNS-139]|nr:hypothetical protein BJF78_31095 [Pseudonocardia sp. CNS-139]
MELAAGDLGAARELMAAAAAAALAGRDGPVGAGVAEVGAAVLLAEGDPEGAGLLLGVAARQRGAPDRGSPDVAAAYVGIRKALGAARPRPSAAAARCPGTPASRRSSNGSPRPSRRCSELRTEPCVVRSWGSGCSSR